MAVSTNVDLFSVNYFTHRPITRPSLSQKATLVKQKRDWKRLARSRWGTWKTSFRVPHTLHFQSLAIRGGMLAMRNVGAAWLHLALIILFMSQYTLDPETIEDTKVLATYLDGRLILFRLTRQCRRRR